MFCLLLLTSARRVRAGSAGSEHGAPTDGSQRRKSRNTSLYCTIVPAAPSMMPLVGSARPSPTSSRDGVARRRPHAVLTARGRCPRMSRRFHPHDRSEEPFRVPGFVSSFGQIATIGIFMTRQHPAPVEIDRDHGAAICAEIGDRLGYALARNSGQLPHGLSALYDDARRALQALEDLIEADGR